MASNQKKNGLNKNILLLVILVPLLVVVGMFAGYYILSPGDQGDGVKAEEELDEEAVVPFDEFLVNLNPSSNTNGYVRMTIALGTKHERGEEIIETNLEKIRDAVIYTTNRQTRDTLYDERGRLVLKGTLVEEINEVLGLEVVSNVYVTEFIVQ